mmetsp:Transcript_643/g.1427  ORF Transcript_643/g.1427 Transcript_643/m.1427 type:complete len:87 (+) Transcript_643:1533-1793(+)
MMYERHKFWHDKSRARLGSGRAREAHEALDCSFFYMCVVNFPAEALDAASAKQLSLEWVDKLPIEVCQELHCDTTKATAKNQLDPF